MMKSKYRVLIQCIFFAFTNAYIKGFIDGKIFTGKSKQICFPGLNCYSCPGALFACPVGALQNVMGKHYFKLSLYVIGFISLIGIICGRFVCGFLCPFGLVQDLLYRIPIFNAKKEKSFRIHHKLIYLKYIILVFFVILLPRVFINEYGSKGSWFCKFLCPSGTLFGALPLILKNDSLKTLVGSLFWWKIFVLLIVTFVSIIKYRPFCKYLCPLGALYGLFNKISFYQIKVDVSKCTNCGQCEKVCKMSINPRESPNSIECIRCNACIDSCCEKALYITNKKVLLKAA